MHRPWTKVRSDIAVAKRRDPNADVSALLAELRVSRLAAHIETITAEAPPLTDDQRRTLAALIRGGASS